MDWHVQFSENLWKDRLRGFVHLVRDLGPLRTYYFPRGETRETHENMSLGSHKVDRACSFRKNLRKVRSHGFVHPVHDSGPIRTGRFHSGQIARNISKHEFESNKEDWTRSLRKYLQKVCSDSFMHPVHDKDPVHTNRSHSRGIARNASKYEFWV